MTALPVMVGFGGINPAGRVSFNRAYGRLVIDKLGAAEQAQTYASLAALMGLEESTTDAARQQMLDHTLIRRIESFDPEQVQWQANAHVQATDSGALHFRLPKRQLPETLPAGWQVAPVDDRTVEVTCPDGARVLLPDQRASRVTSAGQLPSGFDPGQTYASRNHPRGLQMAIYGASDAIRSTGFSVADLKAMVAPDEFAVYSGSAMGQLDTDGYGGLLQNPLSSKRPTSKNCALGLPEMAGDFVNAYVLGSVGDTAGIIGACATFLYNVKQGMDDIQSGKKRIVVVGNSEAPVVPHVIEGYRTMGALAEDEVLMQLDGASTCDNRRACRPFSSNAGFTVAEASVWLVLMDDALALEHGARVLGAVGDVYVNADGYKKSISGPGIGNYITTAKAMASVRTLFGDEVLRHQSHMQAHGTGTPQNRVTESHIFNELAKTFGIDNWLVGAVKCYLGHSMAPAGGDQLSAILGAWQHGWIPGISTIDHIADDVHHSHLNLSMQHTEINPSEMPVAFVNSKGFGGNNATGFFISPERTLAMLGKRHGSAAMQAYQARHEAVAEQAEAYNQQADTAAPIYEFGNGVLEGDELGLHADHLRIPGFPNPISLDVANPYEDMLD
ncbi:MAG: beta-ketoacyl synthase [Pseudomonadota bacterium]